MKYKCIIFDCDGVLVDSEEISNSVLIDMANAAGATVDMEYAKTQFIGKSLKRVFEKIEALIGKELPENFEKEFRERTFEAFKTDIKPVKGIHNLLNKISVPFCVASSGPTEKIRLNLTATNLIDQFENKIFSCYDIGKWKPDPEIFVHAAREMGFKPSECVVIEDSVSGIKAARRGNFDVFGFANKSNSNDFEKEGAHVFFEMENLIELLNMQ